MLNVSAIDHLRARQHALQEARTEHERLAAVRPLDPQRYASIIRMVEKKFVFERANMPMALRVKCLDASLASRMTQHGESHETAGAISGIAHNGRDGTRVRSRGDVEVRHALVAQRLRGEKARIPPVVGLHIPAGDAASNGSVRAARYLGVYQQDRANRRSIAFQQ